MGYAVTADCQSCDYTTRLWLGAGRNDHTTRADWPVHCASCREITVANYVQAPLACSRCGSTEVTKIEEVAGSPGDTRLTWGDLTITDGAYRCPRCGEPALRFSHRRVFFD